MMVTPLANAVTSVDVLYDVLVRDKSKNHSNVSEILKELEKITANYNYAVITLALVSFLAAMHKDIPRDELGYVLHELILRLGQGKERISS